MCKYWHVYQIYMYSCCIWSPLLTVVKPAVQNTYKRCRSRKCIRWHIPVHAIFAIFYLFFLLVLSRPSFTFWTPNKDQKTEQLFYFLLVQVLLPGAPQQPLLCMLLASTHKKCLAQKVVRFGSPGWIPMIQVPFNSSCVALQYETGTKFFHRAVPKLHAVKNNAKLLFYRVLLHTNQW